MAVWTGYDGRVALTPPGNRTLSGLLLRRWAAFLLPGASRHAALLCCVLAAGIGKALDGFFVASLGGYGVWDWWSKSKIVNFA
jgi:hypothetical protein